MSLRATRERTVKIKNKMLSAKEIASTAIFVAILTVSQVILSAINGIELVTVLLAGFAFGCGLRRGFLAVNIFIVIRTVLFGFYPSIMILYFSYYNLFVLVMGLIGRRARHDLETRSFAISLVAVIVLVLAFTVLDDIITPLYYGLDWNTTKGYWIMSLTAIIPQEICAVLTMPLLFPIIVKTLNRHTNRKETRALNEYRTF